MIPKLLKMDCMNQYLPLYLLLNFLSLCFGDCDISVGVCRGFLQSVQANSGAVPQTAPRPLPFRSFIHHKPILETSLNKPCINPVRADDGPSRWCQLRSVCLSVCLRSLFVRPLALAGRFPLSADVFVSLEAESQVTSPSSESFDRTAFGNFVFIDANETNRSVMNFLWLFAFEILVPLFCV